MQMASSFLLSLSIVILLFSVSPLNVIAAKINQDDGKRQTIVIGKWGAQPSKTNGLDFDDGAFTGIREINFEYNDATAIGSFQVTYDLNGKPHEGEKHKSYIKGFTPVKISFDFPNEYITELSGYTGNVQQYVVVRSLTFKTNIKTYGPYGVTSGTPFNLPITNGLIVGFKGSIGYWLDNFGVYLSL